MGEGRRQLTPTGQSGTNKCPYQNRKNGSPMGSTLSRVQPSVAHPRLHELARVCAEQNSQTRGSNHMMSGQQEVYHISCSFQIQSSIAFSTIFHVKARVTFSRQLAEWTDFSLHTPFIGNGTVCIHVQRSVASYFPSIKSVG